MIRLRRTYGDERIRPLLQRLANEKLQLAGLVTAEHEACLIVAFDQQLRPTEFARKSRKEFQRRQQLSQRETGKPFDVHREEF